MQTGDKSSNTVSLTLVDKTSVATVTSQVVVKIFPNPVVNTLTIDLDKADAGMYTIQAYNMSGAFVADMEMNIGPGSYTGSVNTSAWAPGMYFISIQKDGYKHVVPVVKQ
ncbi:MAG: T9SS type A sorting domain-containing protein [Taibaiella sp.]|nr:T9SS type A sorting domain-containing protein [Taibaiella sp.]